MTSKRVPAPLPLAGLAALPLAAHYSFRAEYDSTARVTLTGVVSKVEWTAPHVALDVGVKHTNGIVTACDLEGYAPGKLMRTEFDRDLVSPGESITGFRAQDNLPRVSRCEAVVPDSKEYDFGGASEFEPLTRRSNPR